MYSLSIHVSYNTHHVSLCISQVLMCTISPHMFNKYSISLHLCPTKHPSVWHVFSNTSLYPTSTHVSSNYLTSTLSDPTSTLVSYVYSICISQVSCKCPISISCPTSVHVFHKYSISVSNIPQVSMYPTSILIKYNSFIQITYPLSILLRNVC